MIEEQTTRSDARRTGIRRRPGTTMIAAAVLVLTLVAAGCSKDDGAKSPETTTTEQAGPPTDAKSQQKAFDANERALATVRLPGAVGYFAKSSKTCPSGKAPLVTRTDESSLPPSQVVEQLTPDLEDLGWTYEHLPDGKELYTKDPYQLVIDASASGGGTTADLEITSNLAACP